MGGTGRLLQGPEPGMATCTWRSCLCVCVMSWSTLLGFLSSCSSCLLRLPNTHPTSRHSSPRSALLEATVVPECSASEPMKCRQPCSRVHWNPLTYIFLHGRFRAGAGDHGATCAGQARLSHVIHPEKPTPSSRIVYRLH